MIDGESRAVEPRGARTRDVGVTVNPHYRRTSRVFATRSPHAEAQALRLISDDWRAFGEKMFHRRKGLERMRAVRVGHEYFAVRLRGIQRSKAETAHRWVGVGNSEKSLIA